MDCITLLRPLEDLELKMEACYRRLGELYGDDAEAGAVFARLAMEERKHATLVQHVRKSIRGRERNGSAGVASERTDDVLKTLARALALETATFTGLEDAVRKLLSLERAAAEAHYRGALADAYPDISSLLQVLGGDDRVHVERLEKLARSRGYAID